MMGGGGEDRFYQPIANKITFWLKAITLTDTLL